MAQPLRKEMDSDTITIDPDAQRRIDQVRLRQLAYRIKTRYPVLTDDDVEALAIAVLEASDQVKNPTLGDLHNSLVRHGHRDEYAEMLLAAISA